MAVGPLTAIGGILLDMSLSWPMPSLLLVVIATGSAILLILGLAFVATAGSVTAIELDNWLRGRPTNVVVERARFLTLLREMTVLGTAVASAGGVLAPQIVGEIARHQSGFPMDAEPYVVLLAAAFGVWVALMRWWRMASLANGAV